MESDIFISYSRLDNDRGQVDALCKHLASSYETFSGKPLRYFLDTSTINGMDDWRNNVQEHLRGSRLFLAILSPSYIKSEYCRWEWEDFVRYEAMRQCLGDGVAPVFFLKLDEADSKADSSIASWVQEIRRRQRFDLFAWKEKGELALHEEHVRQTLDELHASVRERLDRSARALRSPSNILRHNPAFVGRVRELTQVREALCKNKLGVLGTAQARATVQGIGGMGKTELALAYAHAFAWDYPGGRWQVSCETISDLRAALSSLNGPLGFSYSREEIADISLRFERVLRELSSRERCLIILDNVSEPELLAPDLLDRLPRNGQLDLIATTRLASASIPGSAQESSFIAVDELPPDDSLALMRSHQPSGKFVTIDEENEARLIVKLLRGFTLAVETAAIFLGRNVTANACRTYRERIERALLEENEAAAKDSTVAVRHRIASIAETLAVTFESLDPLALEILNFAAQLAPDAIPVMWIFDLIDLFADDLGGEEFVAALKLLLGMRLLQPVSGSEEDGTLVVRAHRLVQEYINSCMENEELTFRQQALFGFLKSKDDALLENPNWVDSAWEAEPLTQLAYTWSEADRPLPSFIYDFAASRWHGIADWHRAEPLMRRALEFEEEAEPPRPVILVSRLNSLAVLLKESGRYEEARTLYERTLELHNALPEVNERYLCIAKRNLAMLLITMPTRTIEDVDEALRLCNEARDMAEKSVGTMDALFSTSLFDLGRVLMAQQRPGDAEPVFRQALGINVALLPEGHPEISRIQNALSAALSDQGKHSEVRELLEQATASDEKSHGSNHPIMANRWYHKALVEFDAGDFVKAEELLRKSLHMLLVQTFRTQMEAPGKDLVSQRYMLTLRHLDFDTEQSLEKLGHIYSEARKEVESAEDS